MSEIVHQGQWIVRKRNGREIKGLKSINYTLYCSECNEASPWFYAYCPHCGIRMMEEYIIEGRRAYD